MLQVTQIVRFLLERGLRFRNLGFCGHDLMRMSSDLQLFNNAPVTVPIYPDFFHERLDLMEGHGRRAAGGRPTS